MVWSNQYAISFGKKTWEMMKCKKTGTAKMVSAKKRKIEDPANYNPVNPTIIPGGF